MALQGDFAAHARVLTALGTEVVAVRRPAHLGGLSALILPGGESTTLSLLLDAANLREPLRELIAAGLPTLATCAGVILLARRLTHDLGSIKVRPLALLDAAVDRNAYGRQVDSFEAEVAVDWSVLGLATDDPAFRGIFIRAPGLRDLGPSVHVAARLDGEPVLLRQGSVLASAFHPELAGDPRLHEALLSLG